MVTTNFPNGISAPSSVGAGSGLPFASRYIFVDSASTGASGDGSLENPYRTIGAALTNAVANKGECVVLLPNHAETVTGIGGVTNSKAGVTVVGIGDGNQRPRILLDGGTSVTWLVSGADVTIRNVEVASGHASVVTAFDVTGVNCTLDGIEFTDNTTSEFFLVCVKASGAANTADGLIVKNCRRYTVEAATDFITHTNGVTNMKVLNNTYIADAATGAGLILSATTKVLLGLECIGNYFVCGNTAGDLLIDNDASTNSGIAAWNYTGHHDVAGQINIDCDGIRQFQNFQTSSDTESGVLIPAADTNT